jgi:hypothetical protein
MLPLTDKLPVIIVEPVTTKEPEISRISAFEENTVPVLPFTEKLPVTPRLPVISVEPEIVVLVFTTRPRFGEIAAETDPLAICDRFKPTIPDAGILKRLAPEPENVPSANEMPEPDTFKLPVIVALPICESEPVDRKLPLTIGLSMIITYTRLI